MARLVIKKEIWLKFLEKGALVEAPQEEGFIHIDLPVH